MKTVIVEMLESDLDKLNKFKMVESHPAIVEFVNNHLQPFEVDDSFSLNKLIAACKNLLSLDFDCVSYEVNTEYDAHRYDEEEYVSIGRVAFDDLGFFVIYKKDLLTAIEQYEF